MLQFPQGSGSDSPPGQKPALLEQVIVAGVMEHIEEAGVHSGDSACAIPPYSLPGPVVQEIREATVAMAQELNVIGLMNVQFAVKREDGRPNVYVLEVNPRASRTVPFVSKATGIPLAKVAAKLMIGAIGIEPPIVRIRIGSSPYRCRIPALAMMAGGLDQVTGLEGHSLAPLLKDPEAKWPWPALTTFGLFGLANTIVGYVVAATAQRLVIQGKSEFHPLVANTSANNRKTNRRVEISLLKREKAVDASPF